MKTTPLSPEARLGCLRALADPTRLAIVDALGRGSVCACDLRSQLHIPAPLISHHLHVLCEAGLVQCQKMDRRLEVTLNRGVLAEAANSLLPKRAGV